MTRHSVDTWPEVWLDGFRDGIRTVARVLADADSLTTLRHAGATMTALLGGWTGGRAHDLRAAWRLSHRGFAQHLGVPERTVSLWATKPDRKPHPHHQAALDASLARGGPEVLARFLAHRKITERSNT